ncbi:hypothetical protein [Carnimonas bestiolae]|uniref:hypothetical protein n=1 Tax=Carnimonas bestiolae TaxID=3402172 RepID=UPI003EDC4225
MINEQFTISEEQVTQFREKGFLLLKKFYSSEFTDYINSTIGNKINPPSDKYQSGFSRLAFDMYDGDEKIKSLLSDKNFHSVLKKLTSKNMFFAQALSFELEKLKNKGFPWHIGTQSFGYHQYDDYGCTIWAPLIPINSEKQRGGMAYVPKDKVNGEFLYQYVDPSVFAMLENKIKDNKAVELEEFVEWRDGPLNDTAMKAILDYFAVEDNFEVGDALIFDKYTIHKSIMLDEGDFDSRAAFVLRFFSADSTYDQKRAEDLEIPRTFFGYEGPTKFHLALECEDGEKLINSKLFDGQDYRLID